MTSVEITCRDEADAEELVWLGAVGGDPEPGVSVAEPAAGSFRLELPIALLERGAILLVAAAGEPLQHLAAELREKTDKEIVIAQFTPKGEGRGAKVVAAETAAEPKPLPARWRVYEDLFKKKA